MKPEKNVPVNQVLVIANLHNLPRAAIVQDPLRTSARALLAHVRVETANLDAIAH